MHRSRLQPGQAQLVQPFADGALMHLDREPALHHSQQVHASPADHFVYCQIGTFNHQLMKFGHLRLRQRCGAAGDWTRFQPLDAALVVAMHPRHLPDSARSSALVWSIRVIFSGAPIQCLRRANRRTTTSNRNFSWMGTPHESRNQRGLVLRARLASANEPETAGGRHLPLASSIGRNVIRSSNCIYWKQRGLI